MQTRIIVNGAYGKMGILACEAIENHAGFELVGRLSRQDDLAKTITNTNAQVVVELTRADCVYENSLTIINCNVHPVIGASGLQQQEIATLQQLCAEKELGGIIAPNFSIGALLMMRFSELAARYMPEVEIIEMHHQQKFDAPSGTALRTAEMIEAARTKNSSFNKQVGLNAEVRGGLHHGVNIHSVRLPGVLAQQQVTFGGQGETLTICHNSIDRASFMPGIVLACERVQHLHDLCYGLEHLLDD